MLAPLSNYWGGLAPPAPPPPPPSSYAYAHLPYSFNFSLQSAHGGGHGGTEHGGKHSGEGGKSCCDKLVVAAIDFGTTYSGYAFSFKHEYEKECTKVSSNNWTAGSRALVSLKTPTTLLLKPDKTFEAFGYEAEDRYADLALDEEHGDWYYFRRFKMMLFEKIVRRVITLLVCNYAVGACIILISPHFQTLLK